MKERQVSTTIWSEFVQKDAPLQARYLYNYLTVSPHINQSAIFMCPDAQIMLDTRLTDVELKVAKDWLSDNKYVLFLHGWIMVVDEYKNNSFIKNEKNHKTFEREILAVPRSIKAFFEKDSDTAISTSGYRYPEVTIPVSEVVDTAHNHNHNHDQDHDRNHKDREGYWGEKGNAQLLILIFSAIFLLFISPILIQKPKPIVVFGTEPEIKVAKIASDEGELRAPDYPRDRSVEVQAKIEEVSTRMFGGHAESFKSLAFKESGFNPYAQNEASGACGLPQAMPCSKMNCELGDVSCQVEWMADYIERRYGNPTNALTHWESRQPINGVDVGHWY